MKRKNRIFGLAVFLLIGTLSVLLCGAVYSRIYRSPISRPIDPRKPMVALTFDGGPSPRYTPQILDVLYERQTPATFFLVGERMEESELLVKELAASGHQLECHTYSHGELTGLSGEEIRREVELSQAALEAILPGERFHYLRPTYDSFTPQVEQWAGLPLVRWTLDSRDTQGKTGEEIYFKVLDEVEDGDVILLHECEETIRVLDSLIGALQGEGYQLVTLDQLVEYLPPEEREALPIYGPGDDLPFYTPERNTLQQKKPARARPGRASLWSLEYPRRESAYSSAKYLMVRTIWLV